MKTFRNALPLGIMGFCALGAFYCFYTAANSTSPTPRDSTYVNFLLCLLSVIASWIGSHYYAVYSAKNGTEEKIDTIAQQSTEKILNQSAQLWQIERFLENSVKEAEGEPTIQIANNTLRNRVVATAQMIRLLRSSNNTFTSDWAGVSSPTIKEKMENQVKGQQELLSIYSEFNNDFQSHDENNESEPQGRRAPETLKRIQEAAKDLPAAALPITPTPYAKAVTITQIPAASAKDEAVGSAILHVERPVDNATGRVKLHPELSEKPDVSVNIQNVPDGMRADQFTIRAGTATNRGFNIHLTANETDLIPVGDYDIGYHAKPQKLLFQENE